MERSEMIRASIAAVLGAVAGVLAAIMLGFTPIWWCASGVLTAVVSFCAYRPREVVTLLGELLEKREQITRESIRASTVRVKQALRERMPQIRRIAGRILWRAAEAVTVALFAIACLSMLPAIGITALVLFAGLPVLLACFIAVLTGALATVIGMIFGLIVIHASEKPSRHFPILSALGRAWAWIMDVHESADVNEVIGVYDDGRVFRRDSFLIALSWIPIAASVQIGGALYIPLYLIDVFASILIALASTWRLIAVTGALVGFVAGCGAYSAGLNLLLIVTIGALVAAVIPPIGRALRHITASGAFSPPAEA